jgi:hypothetical protein
LCFADIDKELLTNWQRTMSAVPGTSGQNKYVPNRELFDTLFDMFSQEGKRNVNDYDFMPPFYAWCKCKGLNIPKWKCARLGHSNQFNYSDEGLPTWLKASTKDVTEHLLVEMMNNPEPVDIDEEKPDEVGFMEQKCVLYCLAIQIQEDEGKSTLGASHSSSKIRFYFGHTTSSTKDRWYGHIKSHCKVTLRLATERRTIQTLNQYIAILEDKQIGAKPLLCDRHLMLSHLINNKNVAVVVLKTFSSNNAVQYAESEFINRHGLHEKSYCMNLAAGDFRDKEKKKDPRYWIKTEERNKADKWLDMIDERKEKLDKQLSSCKATTADDESSTEEELDDLTYKLSQLPTK